MLCCRTVTTILAAGLSVLTLSGAAAQDDWLEQLLAAPDAASRLALARQYKDRFGVGSVRGLGRGAEGAAKVRAAVTEKSPLKVASTAEDIAQLVCFLASPASRSMSGEIVRIDAGVHLVW